MDAATAITLLTGLLTVAVSAFSAFNARKAMMQSRQNSQLSAAIMTKTAEVEHKIDGRLSALIAAIRAQAEADAAAARAAAALRESNAFSAGQDDIRSLEPPATATAVANVASQVAAVQTSITDAAQAAKP